MKNTRYFRWTLHKIETLVRTKAFLGNLNYGKTTRVNVESTWKDQKGMWRGALDATLCDEFRQWLATCQLVSPCFYTNKTDYHDISDILLKVSLTINLPLCYHMRSVLRTDVMKTSHKYDDSVPTSFTIVWN